MDIRSGKYMHEDGTIDSSFFDILDSYEKRFGYAATNTDLPDEPDMSAVQELVMTVNEKVIREN